MTNRLDKMVKWLSEALEAEAMQCVRNCRGKDGAIKHLTEVIEMAVDDLQYTKNVQNMMGYIYKNECMIMIINAMPEKEV